jgi:glycosyltransferase involved in cell wall biosynthesis
MPYRFGWGDNQGRDIGALANGLRQLGEDVEFLVLDNRNELSTSDVRCVSFSDLIQPTWWKNEGSGIFVTTYGTNSMLQIYTAARCAGWKVWARTDCDGVPGPSGGLKKYFSAKITEYIDLQRRQRDCTMRGTFLGMVLGLARGFAGCAMAKAVNRRLLASFSQIDLIMVETDYSLRSFSEYFLEMGRSDLSPRLRLVSPAISETFQWNPNERKCKTIIAVGQWWRFQKNMEFLCQVITAARKKFPSVSWKVVGLGSDLVESRLRGVGVSMGDHQVQCFKHIAPEKLNQINQRASIIFYSSRHEGFPNTLCEALCCGASFVGTRGIQAFDYCESKGLGTTYPRDDLSSAIKAIGEELEMWDQGKHSAFFISKNAISLFHRRHVAAKLRDLRQASFTISID